MMVSLKSAALTALVSANTALASTGILASSIGNINNADMAWSIAKLGTPFVFLLLLYHRPN